MRQFLIPRIAVVLLLALTACSAAAETAQPASEEAAPAAPADTASTAAENDSPIAQTGPIPDTGVIDPAQLEYLGAFRLPGFDERPRTFEYGGNAATFNPDGDPAGGSDGFPGSLFIMGHDRIPYGELPNGDQLAEISIPAPVISTSPEDLNTAEFLQDFSEIDGGQFASLEEIPRIGLQYLNNPATGPLVHVTWGAHFQESPTPSQAWISPDLSQPNMQGAWYIGEQSLYSVDSYLFEIPSPWAETFGGKYLATGRYRDGGWSGMGPALFAYTPWQDDGSPSPAGTRLQETVLLLYENSYNTEEIAHAMNGYQHADSWEGGAWLTDAAGNAAVIFAGTKGTGDKYWYGYIDPAGPDHVCVDTQFLDFPTCRTADGGVCSPEDFEGCCDELAGACASLRGWWSSEFTAEIIFYDPADLARVASGELESWEPQPYAILDIDEHLFFNPPEWEQTSLGWGQQRNYRIGDVAYDRANNLLYILELFGDEARPLVHVWRIN